jgi:hypothetical protein
MLSVKNLSGRRSLREMNGGRSSPLVLSLDAEILSSQELTDSETRGEVAKTRRSEWVPGMLLMPGTLQDWLSQKSRIIKTIRFPSFPT